MVAVAEVTVAFMSIVSFEMLGLTQKDSTTEHFHCVLNYNLQQPLGNEKLIAIRTFRKMRKFAYYIV